MILDAPSQPEKTGLEIRGTSLPTGSGASPLRSRDAMQPSKPVRDSTWRGRLVYMSGGRPPGEGEGEIWVNV